MLDPRRCGGHRSVEGPTASRQSLKGLSKNCLHVLAVISVLAEPRPTCGHHSCDRPIETADAPTEVNPIVLPPLRCMSLKMALHGYAAAVLACPLSGDQRSGPCPDARRGLSLTTFRTWRDVRPESQSPQSGYRPTDPNLSVHAWFTTGACGLNSRPFSTTSTTAREASVQRKNPARTATACRRSPGRSWCRCQCRAAS